VALVRQRGIEPRVFGSVVGASKLLKLTATVWRGLRLARLFLGGGQPRFLIGSSRSSALAAWFLRIPAYIVCDYEFAELGTYRQLGASILYPEVIGAEHFQALGFPATRLISFPGIKEDISFTYADVDAVEPLDLGIADPDLVRVLLRPPAEKSHYYSSESGSLYGEVLRTLAENDQAVLVFSPRYPEQVADLEPLTWRNPPVVLDNRANFVALLKAVDAIVCSGGTMLREAACLGVPGFSIFRGRECAVDRFLATQGLLTFVREIETFKEAKLVRKQATPALAKTPAVIDHIISRIENRAG